MRELFEPAVLAAQLLELFLMITPAANGFADQRRDHGEEAQVLVQAPLELGRSIHTKRAEHIAARRQRHAQERDLRGVDVNARARPVEELRLAGDARDERGLAAIDHAPDDAFADLVATAPALFIGQAVRALFADLAGQPIEHRDHRALGAHLTAQMTEHGGEHRVEIIRRREQLLRDQVEKIGLGRGAVERGRRAVLHT